MLKLASRVRWSRIFGCILFVSFPGSLAGFCCVCGIAKYSRLRPLASFVWFCLLQCFSFVGFQKCGFLLAANLLVASLPRLQNKKASTVCLLAFLTCTVHVGHPECKKMTLYWCLISSPPFLLCYFCVQWINLWFRGSVIHAFPPALNLSPFWFWVFWFSRCRPCPSGTYSKQLLDDKGVTYMCEPCAPGWVQVLARRHMCIIIVIRHFIGWETKAQKLGCSFFLPEMKVKFGVPVSSNI